MDTTQTSDTQADAIKLIEEKLEEAMGHLTDATGPILPLVMEQIICDMVVEREEGHTEGVMRRMFRVPDDAPESTVQMITASVAEFIGNRQFELMLKDMGGVKVGGIMVAPIPPEQLLSELPLRFGAAFIMGMRTMCDVESDVDTPVWRALNKLVDEDEGHLTISKRAEQDIKDGHQYLTAMEFGREAEDSPMAGGALYGTGSTMYEALAGLFAEEDERKQRQAEHDQRQAEQTEAGERRVDA